jgi:hypothetical protein
MARVDELLPEPPDWLPLEEYGIAIPVLSLGVGLWVLFKTIPGIREFWQLTIYGQIGLAFVASVGIVLLFAAGYTYSQMNFEWWLKTEEEDAKPVTIETEDE